MTLTNQRQLHDNGKLVCLAERRAEIKTDPRVAVLLAAQTKHAQDKIERATVNIGELIWAMAQADTHHVPDSVMYAIAQLEKEIANLRKVNGGK